MTPRNQAEYHLQPLCSTQASDTADQQQHTIVGTTYLSRRFFLVARLRYAASSAGIAPFIGGITGGAALALGFARVSAYGRCGGTGTKVR